MPRIRPAILSFLLAVAWQGNALSQNGSTTIYAQPRSTALAASDAAQPMLAADRADPSFPSLKPRPPSTDVGHGSGEVEARSSKIAAPTITVASSLAVVLGLFAALVWGSRKFGNGSMHKGSIPKEVMQSLGSTAIDARTHVTMLRCGNRILVLGQTAGAAQTLCEITDPEEVQALTAACLGSSKQDFATALRAIEEEKTSGGFLGSKPNNLATPTRRRLFTSA